MSRHDELRALVGASPRFMAALQAVRTLGLASWCIGAGAVRNLVWDALHGHAVPSPLADVDVAYFDAGDLGAGAEQALQRRLEALAPGLPWEVTNQARVHLWFEGKFGEPYTALTNTDEAPARFVSPAFAVGVRLEADDSISVVAPFGLEDAFDLVLRPNPTRPVAKGWTKAVNNALGRWPELKVVAPSGA